MLRINVPTSIAGCMANLIRCQTLTQTETWRPCVLLFDSKVNMLEVAGFNCTVAGLFAWLSSLTFVSDKRDKSITESYEVNGQITVDDLSNQSEFIITGDSNVSISTYTACSFSVIYVKDVGIRSQEENMALAPVTDLNKLMVFGTSHMLDVNIHYTIEGIDSELSSITFEADSELEEKIQQARENLAVYLTQKR